MKWYTGIYELSVLIDPATIHFESTINLNLLINQTVKLSTCLNYLDKITTPINITFYYPQLLKQLNWTTNEYVFIPKITKIIRTPIKQEPENSRKTKEYLLSLKHKYNNKINGDIKNLISKIPFEEIFLKRDADYIFNKFGLNLFDYYFSYKCDYLITSNKMLSYEREKLKKDYKIWITNFDEFLNELEIFLKGNGVFIEVSKPLLGVAAYGLDISTYYPMTDPDFQRYIKLWNKLYNKSHNEELNQYLRFVLFHRYSFLKYSYDQISFNLQQAERFDEGDRYRGHHYFLASYHINNFYIILWGFLDNLAWIFNNLFRLGFKKQSQKQVGFDKNKYRKILKEENTQFYTIIFNDKYIDWMDKLLIKRHPAAHRLPLYLSTLVKEENLSFISDRMIVVDDKYGKSIFEAHNHIEYDLKMLHEFMSDICTFFQV